MAESGITREWLEELRSRNDIVTTVSRYVQLQQKGRVFWGRCPFHHEKTPSFAVDPARQYYHCFGCGESGDVFKFIGKIENVEFMDVVRMLAEEAHMEVPSQRFGGVDEGVKKKRDAMYEINRLAARHYHDNLYVSGGSAAGEYLDRRGVTPAMIKKFGLGVSLDYSEIVRFLRSQNCDLELAREGGLLGSKTSESGSLRYYDMFGGRLMFPILDSYGNVVAFGGRILEKSDDKAKYKNTGSTFIFDKSKNIYGINLIKKLRLKETVDTLILCEGYVDVIALHQAGFHNAVASMGTALTTDQCRILGRFAKKVIISYDGDSAGQKATMRGLELLSDAGLEVKVLSLPDGLDPDDLIKQHGRQAYQDCLDAAVPYFDFKLNALSKGFDLNTFDGKTRFATAAVEEISKLDNKLEQEQYLRKAQMMSGFSTDSLMRQMSSKLTDDGVKTAPIKSDVKVFSATEKAARFILYALVNRKQFVGQVPKIDEYLDDGALKKIYDAFRDDTSLTIASAYEILDESCHKALAEIADEDQGTPESGQATYYDGCVTHIARSALERELAVLSKEYDNDIMNANKERIMRRMLEIQRELKSYK